VLRLRLIVNPKAGSAAAKRRLPEIRRALAAAGLEHDMVETRGPGDAGERLREARADGIECVGIVGGDGTLNEVSQGYIDASGSVLPGPDLALFPAGTGGDFRRTFELDNTAEQAVARLKRAAPRPLDLGILELVSDAGEPVTRAFINIASFGMGGLLDRIVNQGPKWMGGRAAFLLGTIRASMVYENAPVRVRVDGEPFMEGPIVNVAIANGRYFGGGMKVAPQADPADGMFDVVAIGDLMRSEAFGFVPKLYRGTHLEHALVKSRRGREVVAEPLRERPPVLIDMDGETPGRLPLRARVAPSALRIRV